MNRARWALVVSAIVAISAMIGAIVMLVGFTEVSDRSKTEGQLAGVWVGETAAAPGTIHFSADGSLEARGLSIYGGSVLDPLVERVSELDAPGQWHLTEDLLFAEFEDGKRKLQVTYLVMSSPFGEVSIRAIVGDPDDPLLTQVFRRRD